MEQTAMNKNRAIELRVFDMRENKMMYGNDIKWHSSMFNQYGNFVLMLWTGERSNVDGRKIFVGDIIIMSGETNIGHFKQFKGVVVDRGHEGIVVENGKDFMELGLKRYDYEIAGNIYQTSF